MPRFRVVPDRSQVWIDARSSVHPIETRTDGLEGFLDLDVSEAGRVSAAAPPAGRLSLPVDRLRSGNRLEDRELQKRIDARRFPTIDGVLTSLDTSGEDGRYQVKGDVVFHGVQRTYENEMTVQLDGDTVQLRGEATFDIRDFGVQPPRILLLRVEPEVTVRVDILAQKES